MEARFDPSRSARIATATTAIFNVVSSGYLAFLKRRFRDYSRGMGGWKPLTLATLLARRRGKGKKASVALSKAERKLKYRNRQIARSAKRSAVAVKLGANTAILRDIGTLSNSLGAGQPGNAIIINGNKMSVGIQGGNHGDGLSIGKLAHIHHYGTANIPARPIVVRPDDTTLNNLRRRATAIMTRAMRGR